MGRIGGGRSWVFIKLEPNLLSEDATENAVAAYVIL